MDKFTIVINDQANVDIAALGAEAIRRAADNVTRVLEAELGEAILDPVPDLILALVIVGRLLVVVVVGLDVERERAPVLL